MLKISSIFYPYSSSIAEGIHSNGQPWFAAFTHILMFNNLVRSHILVKMTQKCVRFKTLYFVNDVIKYYCDTLKNFSALITTLTPIPSILLSFSRFS